MSVYFIDLNLFDNFIELCIIDSKKPFQPYLLLSPHPQCKECIFQHVDMDKIFYVKAEKYKNIKDLYPELKVVAYQGTPRRVPSNILCPYLYHNNCSYKTAFAMCIDYLNFDE